MDHLKEAPDYLQDDHLSRGTKAYLKVLNGGAPVESLPVGEARRVLADVQAAVHVDLSGIEESGTDGRKRRVYAAPEPRPPLRGGGVHLPAFVFIHGGAGCWATIPPTGGWCATLSWSRVVRRYSSTIRLRPRRHFPKAVEEVYAAVKWVAENGREIGVDGSRLALAGNSVGGNMSLAAALVAEDHGGPRLRTLVLMWPVTDAGTTGIRM